MDGHQRMKRSANGNRGDAVVYPAREDQRAVLKRHFLFGGLGDGEIAELLAHAQLARKT